MTVKKRNIYLKTISIDQAVDRAKQALDRRILVKSERVKSEQVLGRVAARPVLARFSSPSFHGAAMDGIAVEAKKTFSAREDQPLILKRGVDFQPVNTGNPMPPGMDAVVMIEDVVRIDEDTVSIESPAFPWRHVRRIGEDIVATELLFPRNHLFSAYDVGALLSGGIWEVEVWERVRMAVIPTGDEILDSNKRAEPKPGEVVESNSWVLRALADKIGCQAQRFAPVPDDPASLSMAVDKALESDAHIVIVCAGSSAGSKDYTRQVMESKGEILTHGIAAMPGKPSLLAKAGDKLLVGAPGYPVSAVVCFEQLVAPLAAWLGRKEPPEPKTVEVELTRKTPSKLGVEEFMRLSIGEVGGKYAATPLGRGAGNITSMSRAQGVARIPKNSEGVEQGAVVRAELKVSRRRLGATLIAVGSHDNTLDLLADELMGMGEGFALSSSHVGSMGGFSALKSGSAHFAGMHLFDPATGDYNFPFIEKYLPGVEAAVVNLAVRHQGLIVAKGNPKNIRGVEDLASGELSFVNRQRGAGTRILFDHYLKQAGISPDSVNGYGKEEYTHMAVAANVLTGEADCGMGIYAAAKALGLDFVEAARERYDLVIPLCFIDDPRIKAVLELLADPGFQKKINGLGGYETRLSGQFMKKGVGLG